MIPKLRKKSDVKGLLSRGLVVTFTIGVFFGLLLSYIYERAQTITEHFEGLPGGGNESRQKKNIELELPPGTTSIILNIGSNLDPILPRESDGPCAVSLAFEPIVHASIPSHPQLHVVPAAVSYESGLASMHVYNKNSVSSSLQKAAKKSFWNSKNNDQGIKIVPVITFSEVIQSIPEHIKIDFILTDMQGHDFSAVRSVVDIFRSRGVPVLRTEVYMDGITTYEGADNDFCRNWLPMMMENGYELVEVRNMQTQNKWEGYSSQQEALETCKKELAKQATIRGGLNEGEALWKLPSIQDVSYEIFTFPTMGPSTTLFFSSEMYEKCNS